MNVPPTTRIDRVFCVVSGPTRSVRHHGPVLAGRKDFKGIHSYLADPPSKWKDEYSPFHLMILAPVCALCPEPFVIGTTRSLNEPYAPSLLVVGCVVCKGRKTMSSMKDAYLKLLRPMDGQQADPLSRRQRRSRWSSRRTETNSPCSPL